MYSKKLAWVVGVVCVAGCSSTHINVDSQVPVPAQFEEAARAHGATEVAAWWQNWPDPVLQQLIEQGLVNNRNLAAMTANVAAARANAALAAADLGPNVALVGSAGAHNVNIDNPLDNDVRSVLARLGSSLGEDSHRFKGSSNHLALPPAGSRIFLAPNAVMPMLLAMPAWAFKNSGMALKCCWPVILPIRICAFALCSNVYAWVHKAWLP